MQRCRCRTHRPRRRSVPALPLRRRCWRPSRCRTALPPANPRRRSSALTAHRDAPDLATTTRSGRRPYAAPDSRTGGRRAHWATPRRRAPRTSPCSGVTAPRSVGDLRRPRGGQLVPPTRTHTPAPMLRQLPPRPRARPVSGHPRPPHNSAPSARPDPAAPLAPRPSARHPPARRRLTATHRQRDRDMIGQRAVDTRQVCDRPRHAEHLVDTARAQQPSVEGIVDGVQPIG